MIRFKNLLLFSLPMCLVLTGCGEDIAKQSQADLKSQTRKVSKPVAAKSPPKPAVVPTYDFKRAPSEMAQELGKPRVRGHKNILVPEQEMKKSDYNTSLVSIVGVNVGDDYQTIRDKVRVFFKQDGYQGGMGSTTGNQQYWAVTSDRMNHPKIRAYDVVVIMDKTQKAEWMGIRTKCWDGPTKDQWGVSDCS